MLTKDSIINYAQSQGASIIGISRPRSYTEYLDRVRVRLRETNATKADFLLSTDAATFFENLSDARNTLAEAKSIIIIGTYAYDRKGDYGATENMLQGKTARTYAYYPVIRQIAEQVARYINQNGQIAVHGQQIPLKYVTDDIGLGSYGWNGILLTKEYGSFIALRAIITEMELQSETNKSPSVDCESCGRCIKACPTGALYAPYKVNPALCINPLTRREDDIPRALQIKIGNWVCGCDICQEVCPLNRDLIPRAPDHRSGFDPVNHASHKYLGGLARTPDLQDLLKHSTEFVMRRNAAIALGNIGGNEAKGILRQYRKDTPDERILSYLDCAIDGIAD